MNLVIISLCHAMLLQDCLENQVPQRTLPKLHTIIMGLSLRFVIKLCCKLKLRLYKISTWLCYMLIIATPI